MSHIVLRLAGPLQSWSGYRLALNKESSSPTQAVPRKSAINGLLGAAVGSRDLEAIGARYTLHARVERSNPVAEDFQVVGPLPPSAQAVANRQQKLAVGSARPVVPANRGGGNFPTTISKKDYLSHTEFLVAIATDPIQAADWIAALREPVYMTYLGRKSCSPSYPFVLGLWDSPVEALWRQMPHVADRGPSAREPDHTRKLRTYRIAGTYNFHDADESGVVDAPVVSNRQAQLQWVKENLQ